MDIEIKNEEIEEQPKKIWKIIKIISIIILLITLVIVYARFKATSGLKIKEYKITNNKIPETFHGTKLIQISDIHFGYTVNINELEYMVQEINKTKPDIVVLTGDLLERTISDDEKKEIINTLKKIKVTTDKYAIMGDKDYDEETWKEIIEQSNFINLNNKEKYIYNKNNSKIRITNIDTINEDTYSIYVLHEPDKIDNIQNKFDLILAGHSLNGQINIPGIKQLLLQEGAKKYYKEHYIINDTDMYISSGIGTTKFKYRLFNKPSINLYRLTNK